MTENEPYMTYALWGRGDLTEANAKALLEEYVPDNVGTVYRPERITRDEKGLRTALDWFESPDFLGAGGAVPSVDLIQSLTFDRDTQGDDVFLLALFPTDPTHEEFDFIELVQNNGILVIDLARAWDELDLSLHSRPEATTEEKAEARAEARQEVKRGRARKLSEGTGETQEEFTSPTVEAAATTEVIQTEPLDAQGIPELEEAPETVHDAGVPDTSELSSAQVAVAIASMELMAAIDKLVIAKVDEAVERKFAEMGASTAPVVNRPPFEPPYIGEHTKPYYWNKALNSYRPAAGTKPKRGEQLVNFTEEEAAKKGAL